MLITPFIYHYPAVLPHYKVVNLLYYFPSFKILVQLFESDEEVNFIIMRISCLWELVYTVGYENLDSAMHDLDKIVKLSLPQLSHL